MLIDEPSILRGDPILNMVSLINNRSERTLHLKTGVYQIGHFGSSDFLRRNYEAYPSFDLKLGEHDWFGSYGVCDNIEQLLFTCPELEASDTRKFVITLTPITRIDEPSSGGWRWHKWGEYIGTQNPQHEYLFHDKHIDMVYVYHIYERKVYSRMNNLLIREKREHDATDDWGDATIPNDEVCDESDLLESMNKGQFDFERRSTLILEDLVSVIRYLSERVTSLEHKLENKHD